MTDDAIRELLEGLVRRGGLTPLHRLLGFAGRPRARAVPAMVHAPVRALRELQRGTIGLCILEMRDTFGVVTLRELSTAVRRERPLQHHLLIVTEPGRRRVVIACNAMDTGLRHIVLEPRNVRSIDIEVVRELIVLPGESGTAVALRIHRALDRQLLTGRFFRDIRGVRDAVARGWMGLPESAAPERDALALLLLSRLLFLYFLQRRGLLDGDLHFLRRTLARWSRTPPGRGTFYRCVLRTLFFGVLNRRPGNRTARALGLGELPYLNGGLFERHYLERRHCGLDLADGVTAVIFDALLEKYRFTTADTADGEDVDSVGAGIDPEMLGRMFEKLMPGERRSRTGTFYTPVTVVDEVVTDALGRHLAAATGTPEPAIRSLLKREPSDISDRELDAVAAAATGLRVLDPACGSGAFLLSSAAQLASIRTQAHRGLARPVATHDAIAHSLHGVDVLQDAALICSLRLWLTLLPQCERIADVPPLPNLDRRIRQGDALIDPLDVGAACAGGPLSAAAPAGLRRLTARLEPAALAYLSSGPDTRPALRRTLAALESRLARAWLTTLRQQLDYELRDLRARAADTDLFGEPTTAAESARGRVAVTAARLAETVALCRDLAGRHGLPFFSFRVHFAEVDAFDIVVSNPPWVRTHNWPLAVRRLLRNSYRVCAESGWPYSERLTGTPRGAGSQVDLAFLFLERSIRLLRDGGTLGMVLPAKLIRSIAPGGARALLLSSMRVASIVDHSLQQRAVFAADAFTVLLSAHKATAVDSRATVHVRMTRRGSADLRFELRTVDLPLRPDDSRSPWLLAPPDCAAAFRAMQRAGTSVGASGLTVRRGAMTGANDVMVVQDVMPRLGDLARIRAEGWYARNGQRDRRAYAGHVEASALRPVLRGTDVHPWHAAVERHVLYTPLNDDPRAGQPPLLLRFLRRHRDSLHQRDERLGTLQRLSQGMFGDKVVWSDIASDLRVAAVPRSIRSIIGLASPVLPLNTVYFIPCDDERSALLLAAYLNALPVRAFARAIAERAKDAHFRFLAWTVAMLPLPLHWRTSPAADRLIAISRDAHLAGSIAAAAQAEVDHLVAQAYGLESDQLERIAEFDGWLSGRSRA